MYGSGSTLSKVSQSKTSSGGPRRWRGDSGPWRRYGIWTLEIGRRTGIWFSVSVPASTTPGNTYIDPWGVVPMHRLSSALRV